MKIDFWSPKTTLSLLLRWLRSNLGTFFLFMLKAMRNLTLNLKLLVNFYAI